MVSSPRKMSSRNIFENIFRGLRGHFEDILEDIRRAYILNNEGIPLFLTFLPITLPLTREWKCYF